MSPDQQELITNALAAFNNPASAFRGSQISLEYLAGDSEAGAYAEDIALALRLALGRTNASVDDPLNFIRAGSTTNREMILQFSRKRIVGFALQSALHSAGIEVIPAPNEDPEMTGAILWVGTRPRPK